MTSTFPLAASLSQFCGAHRRLRGKPGRTSVPAHSALVDRWRQKSAAAYRLSSCCERETVADRNPDSSGGVTIRRPDRDHVVREFNLDLQAGRAKGSDADDRALKLRIRSSRYIVKRQAAMEDHPVRGRAQRRDIAYQPQMRVSNRDRQPARDGSDDQRQGHPVLIRIEACLDDVVSPREGFAPIAGIENPVRRRDDRRRIQKRRLGQHDG